MLKSIRPALVRSHIPTRLHFLLLLAPLLLAACATDLPSRLWLDAPGWSRAQSLGTAATPDPAAMAHSEAGDIFLFWFDGTPEAPQATVRALSPAAEVLWTRTVAESLVLADSPQIHWDGRRLHLFWLADYQLHWTTLGDDGQDLGSSQILSGSVAVDSYDAALNGEGEPTVWFASARREPGLYALPEGDLLAAAELVDAEGVRPALQYDGAGTLHAVWAYYPTGFANERFYYASYPDGAFAAGRQVVLYRPNLKPTDLMFGPFLGLEDDRAYVLWNIEVRTGSESGKLLTEYVSFPPSQPSQMSGPTALLVPAEGQLAYEAPAAESFRAGPRLSLATADVARTTRVTAAAPNPAAGGELALAFQAQVRHQYRRTTGQVATLFLRDGAAEEFQLLSFTSTVSDRPTLLSDDEGYLYVTWLEKGATGSDFEVYLASTRPEMMAALSRVTGEDVRRTGGEVLFGLLSGAALAPLLVLLWLMAPMALLAITGFMRPPDRGNVTRVGTIVSVVLALIAYSAAKLLVLPGIRTYVPFSAWIPQIADWLQAPLQIAMPALIMIVALWVAWRFTFRRQNNSLLYFMGIFGAVDGLLTLAVYGFLIYNTL